jgi:hypothetical protein
VKFTKDRFRKMSGLAIALVAVLVLFALWYDVSAELKSDWTFASLLRGRRHVGGIVCVALIMVGIGISLCFDFKSDPPSASQVER